MSEQEALIDKVHEHIEGGDVDKAVFACLRLARSISDHFNAVIFLREMRSDRPQFRRQFLDEVRDLSAETQKQVWHETGEIWLAEHFLDSSFIPGEPDKTVLAIGVGEMRRDLEEIDKKITDMVVPHGLGQFDAAAFEDRYNRQKSMLRLRATAIHQILERVRNRCVDYASRVEKQLRSARKTVEFLASVPEHGR